MPEAFKIEEMQINNLKLPAINGRLFCSSRDPEREALQWVNSIASLIHSDSEAVILGLGAGFHVRAFQQRFPQTKLQVIELKSELSARFPEYADLLVKQNPKNMNLSARTLLLEFRPAWLGQENEYKEILCELLNESDESFKLAAILGGLNFTAGVRGFQIKAIDQLFAAENQSEEIKIWRAIRELVQ